jgi:L-threonylcarbamoyladenylate synthase
MPRARLHRPTPRNLARLARVLARGGLVAVPTETVYGLAADALDARACRAIFRAKGRPAHDPLIVHVRSVAQANEVAVLGPAARRLAATFWPGPLTLVLPKRDCVPAIVTAGLPSVAVRMPAHPVFRALLRRCGRPLAAPSANPFGYVSPTTAAHVLDGLGTRIAHILDGGACAIGVESTILDLRDPARPALLRPGAVTRAQLEKALGRRVRAAKKNPPSTTTKNQLGEPATGSDNLPSPSPFSRLPSPDAAPAAALPAPGLLARHYAPRTPLTLHTKLTITRAAAAPREAFLFFRRPALKKSAAPAKNIFWLTERGDAAEAARHLFAHLRALDAGGWHRLHAERAPARSALTPALNDRLARAAAR